ncbi:MFS transporter [Candidatus Bathyarchaeota archaeon]|nr:MFS transporter [Candidatus Bathyarchaeota archaeon]
MSLKEYSTTYYLLCVVAFLSMLSIMVTNPILSLFAKEIGATGVWIGYAVSGYWISRVVLEIPSGYISSRFGYYKPMAFGLALTVLGNVLLVFVKDPVHLVLIRALKGFGAPFFFAVSMTFIINLFDTEKRGKAMGIFQGIEFAGQIIGAGVSGALVENLGWQGGFVFALALSIAALLLFIIPPHIRREAVEGPTRKPLTVSEVLGVLRNQTLGIVAVVTLAEFIMTTGLIMTVLGIYVNESLGFTLSEVGYMMGARSIGFVIAMFTMGSISDRLGRKPVLLFGLASTAVLVLVMSLFNTFLLISAVIVVIGFTSGAIWIVGPVISAEAVEPEKRGAAIGAYRTFFDLGSFLGPIIMTYVMTDFGVMNCFYLASALLLAVVPLTLRIKETAKSSGEVIAH